MDWFPTVSKFVFYSYSSNSCFPAELKAVNLQSLPSPTGPFFTMLVKSPELGAQPVIFLAVSEELEGVTGRYYDVMTEKEPAPQALDEEAARRLWEVSSRLVGLEQGGLSAK